MVRLKSAPSLLSTGPTPAESWLGGRWARALTVLAALMFVAVSLPEMKAKEEKPSRTVAGVVSDEAENPIAGAVVVLTDLQTGKKNATYTGADGAYFYAGLEVTRDYEVQASYKGISSQLRKVSSVDSRKHVTVNLRIPPPKEE